MEEEKQSTPEKNKKCKYCGEPATKYDLLINGDVCDEHANFSRELLILAQEDIGITTFSKDSWKKKDL
ncbi:MAG: hypothetical protein ACTSYA_07035 [Candidatus Kariarchaeaceae archaeon]